MSEKVTSADCTIFRQKAREEGTNVSDIASMFDQPWGKVHRHVSGDCNHDISTSPVDDSEALGRFTVSASDCEDLRSKAQQTTSLLDLTEEVVWDYQTVLRHVRGECEHQKLTVDPIKSRMDRSEDVTVGKCVNMRDAYFDERSSLSEVAETFDVSVGTAERHIKFKCGHVKK